MTVNVQDFMSATEECARLMFRKIWNEEPQSVWRKLDGFGKYCGWTASSSTTAERECRELFVSELRVAGLPADWAEVEAAIWDPDLPNLIVRGRWTIADALENLRGQKALREFNKSVAA